MCDRVPKTQLAENRRHPSRVSRRNRWRGPRGAPASPPAARDPHPAHPAAELRRRRGVYAEAITGTSVAAGDAINREADPMAR
jgi:hypothetical protein